MNREEFLRQLEQLLSGISEEERADAMAFYRSYFEDAGAENEPLILEELESPQKVAESIMKNLGIDGCSGYYNTFANRDAEYYRNLRESVGSIGSEPKWGGTAGETGESYDSGTVPKEDASGRGALAVVIAVITAPLWLTVLLLILSVLLAVVAALFGVAVSVVAVMGVLVVTGFVLLGVGAGMLFSGNPAVGIGLLGAGLFVLALGLLAVLLAVQVFGIFLPWAFRGLVSLCRKPFHKRGEWAV